LGSAPWFLISALQGSLGALWDDCVVFIFKFYMPLNKGLQAPRPWWEGVGPGLSAISQLTFGEVADFLTWPVVLLFDYALFVPLMIACLGLAWKRREPAFLLCSIVGLCCSGAAVSRQGVDLAHTAFLRHLWWICVIYLLIALPWGIPRKALRALVCLPGALFVGACLVQLVFVYERLAQPGFQIRFARGTVRVSDENYYNYLSMLKSRVQLEAGSSGPLLIYPIPGMVGFLLGNPDPTLTTRMVPLCNRPDTFEKAYQALEKDPATTILMNINYAAYTSQFTSVPIDEFTRLDQAARERLTGLAKGRPITNF
jgi:hypothetical protein